MQRKIWAMIAVVGAIALVAQAQTTYTWTGAAGVGSSWEDPANWTGGLVPNTTAGQLSTTNAADIVVFDSETAVDGYMPAGSITTRTTWTAGGKNPQIQLRNGALSLGGTQNWGWNGETLVVGDGDMDTLATATVSWSNLHRDPNGLKTYVIHPDGKLLVSTSVTAFTDDGNQKRAVVRINGGAVEINGTINNHFTNAVNNYVDFIAEGSTFTARFGGQLPDLPTVQVNIGDGLSFRSSEGLSLGARTIDEDNFMVFIPPPSGTLIIIK